MQQKKLLSGLSIFLSVIFIYSCGTRVSSDHTNDGRFCIPDSLLKNVTFDTLHSGSVKSELPLSGRITFNEDKVLRIFPLVSGQVTEVKVTLGDYIEKGKVLAIIESSDMANYFNEYRSSQSEVAIARKNLEVTTNMRNSGVSSEKDYLIAQNEYEKALAEFKKIKEVLKIFGSSFDAKDSTGSGYVIKSPISGFVVDKNVTVGMDLRPDASTNLFTISDLKELWATANVYETDVSKIKPGSDAEIVTLSFPDKKFYGKVERISNILDPETKSMSVKIRLDNRDFKLKPGMFARISISLPEDKKMLIVKSSAIIYDGDKSYVLKYSDKCNVSIEKIDVFKSLNNLNYFESDSLRDGDLLILRNGIYIFTALKSL
jgi:cobalt-zinc-cadmium efflux system membrane fusion protein